MTRVGNQIGSLDVELFTVVATRGLLFLVTECTSIDELVLFFFFFPETQKGGFITMGTLCRHPDQNFGHHRLGCTIPELLLSLQPTKVRRTLRRLNMKKMRRQSCQVNCNYG